MRNTIKVTMIQSKASTSERDNQSDRCKARLQQVSGHNQSDSDTEQKLQQVSGHNQSDSDTEQKL